MQPAYRVHWSDGRGYRQPNRRQFVSLEMAVRFLVELRDDESVWGVDLEVVQ